MHIVNIMFSRGLGGIEQSFVDYCEAITMQGHKVSAIIHPNAKIKQHLIPLGINILGVKNIGGWDAFAKSYLKKMLLQVNPDAIIAHGNRAVLLAKAPAKSISCPVIGVTHNYSVKKLIGLNAIFATTNHLKQEVIKKGQPEKQVYNIPNMIKIGDKKTPFSNFHKTPVIGTMGRFVKKKGFDIFLRSIAELKANGTQVKAIIGGTGEEESSLKKLAKSLDIEDCIKFKGWIKNKEELFDKIDIFCLPSLHEPFGIILLEALMSGKPVITSDSEGPSEIASNKKDALVVPKGDAKALAQAIDQLISEPELAQKLATNGLKTVEQYSIENVGKKMCKYLEDVINHQAIQN